MKKNEYILGLDISTQTIGVSLLELDSKKLILLTHVSPKIKDEGLSQIETLIKKSVIFENEFLKKYVNSGITKVVIEEPLIGSNNIRTVAVLIRFNTLISKIIHETLGIVPEYISSYDSRKYAFPELMAIRTTDKDGKILSERELSKKKPVLFGAYPKNVDKKLIIWGKVADLYPEVIWLYNKKQELVKESFDLSDAVTCVVGFCKQNHIWK